MTNILDNLAKEVDKLDENATPSPKKAEKKEKKVIAEDESVMGQLMGDQTINFPKVGDVLVVGACELRVEEMDGPRVVRLKITKHAEAERPKE